VHFSIQSLDLLSFFDDDQSLTTYGINKTAIINWIYNLQTLPTEHETNSNYENDDNSRIEDRYRKDYPRPHKLGANGGFKGGTFLGEAFRTLSVPIGTTQDASTAVDIIYPTIVDQGYEYDHSHLAMTYTALCTLAALGDDLKRVKRKEIISSIRQLQLENGRYVDNVMELW